MNGYFYALIRWWRRVNIPVRFLLFLVGASLLAFLVYTQIPHQDSIQFGSNLFFFLLINSIIIAIGLMLFLIGRNVIKLIFDRKRNIFGSKLRTRLVVAFVGMTLLPTTILFFMASGLLNNAMEGWFNQQVEEIVNSSIDVAKSHYSSLEQAGLRFSEQIRTDLEDQFSRLPSATTLSKELDLHRRAYDLYSLKILESNREVFAAASNATSEIDEFVEPELKVDALQDALLGKDSVSFEEQGARQFIRCYLPITLAERNFALVASIRVQPELSVALGQVVNSYDEYRKLNFYKQPLKSSYLLTLAMITGFILFAAIWFGFYLAKELVVPIQRLAKGTEEVAQGNYDVHIRSVGDDEIGLLVKSFNKMTSDLKLSRSESEERRVYLESILSNLSVGVIVVDSERKVSLINATARKLLSVKLSQVEGKTLDKILSDEILEYVDPLLDDLYQPASSDFEINPQQMNIFSSGKRLQIACSVGKILTDQGQLLGSALLFDNVTELSKAQHMAAWREVARRIAHEIKNPLTPIKLSAQRLQRLSSESQNREEFEDCAQTIVENVDSIKRLANEFSHFARMPLAELQPTDLNELIADTISPFMDSEREVLIQFIPDSSIPEVHIDREQMRRTFMNLLDNSVSALSSFKQNELPKIMIRTSSIDLNRIQVEIADNGPGIPGEDKVKIFEPYFTTKHEGTGLGLAIVSSVISDHGGKIRLYDNEPHGAKFILELPVSPSVRRRVGVV